MMGLSFIKLIFIFLFSSFFFFAFVSAENETGDLGVMSSVLSPWIEVNFVPVEICNDPLHHVNVRGGFYLNYDKLVGCQGNPYEIEVSVVREIFGFDEVLWSDVVESECDYWDVVDDPAAPLMVPFDMTFSTAFNNLFPISSSQEGIYFEARVVDRPEDFEFNFNDGDVVESERYSFSFVDCGECQGGACCSNGQLLSYGSQPLGKEDEYYCTGVEEVFGESYVNLKDYYCDGVHSGYSVSYDYKLKTCGDCQYCSEGSLECGIYDSSFVFSVSDCDYLDRECRDYNDVQNFCDGFGGVIFESCDDYTNLPDGTACSLGSCSQGECVEEVVCIPQSEFHCWADDNIYWWDSCGVRGDIKESCEFGCESDACLPEPYIECSSDEDCGHVEDWYVCGEDIGRLFGTRFEVVDYNYCVHPGGEDSYCVDEQNGYDFIEECVGECENGECLFVEPLCYSDEDCGLERDYLYCYGGDVYRKMEDRFCVNPGEQGAYCLMNSSENLWESCEFGCENGECVSEPSVSFYASFSKGWDFFSVPYKVSHLSLEEFFGSCFSYVEQIKGEENFYSSELPSYLNTLESLEKGKGYWVYAEEACVWLVRDVSRGGCFVDFEEGWNLMGLPFDSDRGLEEFFGVEFGKVEKVKDKNNFYDSSVPSYLNTLAILEPHSGYWVYVNESFEMNCS